MKYSILCLLSTHSLKANAYLNKEDTLHLIVFFYVFSRSGLMWCVALSTREQTTAPSHVPHTKWHVAVLNCNWAVGQLFGETALIEAETKWTKLCRRNFQMHFLESKLLYFDWRIKAETSWPPFSSRHFEMDFIELNFMNFESASL